MIKKVNKDSNKVYLIRVQPRDPITGKRVNLPIRYAKTKSEASKNEKEIWAIAMQYLLMLFKSM